MPPGNINISNGLVVHIVNYFLRSYLVSTSYLVYTYNLDFLHISELDAVLYFYFIPDMCAK